MISIDKTFVQKSFNRASGEYDAHSALQARLTQDLMAHICLPDQRFANILDIGMGTGHLTALLMERFPAARIHGCDLAINMLRHAAGKGLMNGKGRLFVAADAEQLPYADQSFDLATSSLTFQWLENWRQALMEVFRVLTPGGMLALSVFGSRTFYELRSSYQKACRATGYCLGDSLQLAATRGQMVQDLASCGFTDLQAGSQRVVQTFATANTLVRTIKGMGARNASGRRNKTLGVRRVWKEMSRLYEQDFGKAGGIPATFEVIFARGVRRAG